MPILFRNTTLSSHANSACNTNILAVSVRHNCNPLMRMLRLQRAPIALRNTLTRASSSSSSSSSASFAVTLYDVLSVPKSAELGDLKKAYREKVRIYHPDVCPPGEREESCKMFFLVQEAYETLSDPMLRADYDYNLSFNPHIMLGLQKRNGSGRDEAKHKKWAEQLEGLSRKSRSTSVRDTWGGRVRSFKEAAVHGIL